MSRATAQSAPFPAPYQAVGKGANGAAGSAGATGSAGGAGGRGQDGGSFSYYLDQRIDIGGSGYAAAITSQGGAGGNGGSSSANNGGNGGGGGDADTIDLSIHRSVFESRASLGGIGIFSLGGQGGDAGTGTGSSYSYRSGTAGNGGAANTISLSVQAGGSVSSTVAEEPGIIVQGDGAEAGAAALSNAITGNASGVAGAQGGAGSVIGLDLDGQIQSAGSGILLFSTGGAGGSGGDAYARLGNATGGNGGQGGGGGGVTIEAGADSVVGAAGASGPATGAKVNLGKGTIRLSVLSAGIAAESQGGVGGQGGTADTLFGKASGGAGGGAGKGGNVSIPDADGTIKTSGYAAPGLLAESVGGAGGSGSSASAFFSSNGGNGAPGGAAGVVRIQLADGNIATTGNDSSGAVALSIGGGGGYGGGAQATSIGGSVAIGGQGGDGGVADDATIINGIPGSLLSGSVVTTQGTKSPAMEVQSIAGGGGDAGSAISTTVGPFALAIGGAGGDGGKAGKADAENYGILQANGAGSPAMLLQSIGGGGGDGGFGSSTTVTAQIGVSVAVGGSGGIGGQGGTVDAVNGGQLTTNGTNAYGVEAQSIGGGGGEGGDSIAKLINIVNSPNAPSVVVAVGVGGGGGGGGNGGTVTIDNLADGAVTTQSDDAIGLFGQSIGGGGGDAGDAGTFTQQLVNANVTVNVAVGGSGGAGGSGGLVAETNAGAIITLGDWAKGMFAQSIGGGGGDGGSAMTDSSQASPVAERKSVSASVAVGGIGSAAGNGGTVAMENSGGIGTYNDEAAGIYAQSIGGGGGDGGLGKALGSDGTISANIGVGGGGGAGGNGGTVSIINTGTILTEGGSSPALEAQSVGGGGGNGGDAATGAGSYPFLNMTVFLTDRLGTGLDVENKDGAAALLPVAIRTLTSFNALKNVFAAYNKLSKGGPGVSRAGTAKATLTVRVGGGFGGAGGAGGSGGFVKIQNKGSLETDGPDSADIMAESVGGGGGTGGATNPSTNLLVSNPSSVDVVLGVGGSGGSSGHGGDVSVTSSGRLQTQGDLSDAISAQSIGGGGGDGGETIAQNGVFGKFTLAIGGSGGSSGNGGKVTVNAGQSDELIETFGNGSQGVFAQSVGGGGGMAFMMTAAYAGESAAGLSQLGLGAGAIATPTAIIPLSFDGTDGASGSGGDVNVNLVSPSTADPGALLYTLGANSDGVLAQSVGGGGGLVEGVTQGTLPDLNSLFPATSAGHGGNVNVTLANAFSIYTDGAGSAGVLAQSVGGSGGIINGLSGVDLTTGIRFLPTTEYGSGGNVTVTLANGGNIVTNGARADGIFAQSVGGGGGIIGAPDGDGYIAAGAGNTGGGNAGLVSVSISSAVVMTSGTGAYGVVVVSAGNGNNATRIDLGPGGRISSHGNSAAAIFVDGVGSNVIDNAGVIAGSSSTGVAIAGNYAAAITNRDGGVIIGSTVLPGLSSFENLPGAIYAPGDAVQLGGGTFYNAGTLSPGGDAAITDTAIGGNLLEAPGSRLIVSEQPATASADHLTVTGSAVIGGQIAVAVIPNTVLAPRTTREDIVTAGGSVTENAMLANTPVLSLRLAQPDPDNLDLFTTVDFRPAAVAAADLATPDRDAIGDTLNAIETAGIPAFDALADAVAQLPTVQDLAATYDSLSGEAVADAGQVTLATMRQMDARLTAQAGPFSAASDGMAFSPKRPDLRAWMSAYGGTEGLSGGAANAGLNFQTEGGMVGVEKWFSADAMAGIAAGGSTSNYRVSGQTQNGHSTGGELALYGLQRQGRFYLSGVFSFGHFGLGAQRTGIAALAGFGDRVDDAFNHNAIAGRLEAGMLTRFASVQIAPFAAIDVEQLWQNGFSESAATAPVALRFDDAAETAVPSVLGARFAQDFTFADGDVLSPAAQVAWVHEFKAQHRLTAAFVQAPQDRFVVEGIADPSNAAQLAFSGDLALPNGVRFSATFNSQLAARETAYGGLAGISVAW